jgi:hypothetical protein
VQLSRRRAGPPPSRPLLPSPPPPRAREQGGLLAQQDSSTPATTTALAVAVSLIGNVVAVGALRLGIVGAAGSTVATQLVGAAALFAFCALKEGRLRPALCVPTLGAAARRGAARRGAGPGPGRGFAAGGGAGTPLWGSGRPPFP